MVADVGEGYEAVSVNVRGINLIYNEDQGYYIYNAHGYVVELTDGTGAVIKEYEYDAFGVEKDLDEEVESPFRYSREYFDQETGNIYLRASKLKKL